MLIIIDARIPQEAKDFLGNIGEVFQLHSKNIVYDSIKGHPDIFLLQMEELVIMAPNAPIKLKEIFKKHRIPFLWGKTKLGKEHPETVHYNAVCTKDFLIHKEGLTDSCILHETEKKKFIPVSQAYTRCNLLSLSDGSFITSDRGIDKRLTNEGLEVYYFNSDDVVLEGQEHGFLPGAMGVFNKSVYILGHLGFYSEGERLRQLMASKNMDIIELYKGPIIDGGGIFFHESFESK